MWPAPKWWVVQPGVPRGGIPRPRAVVRSSCSHPVRALHVEFVPRIDPSVACYRSGVIALGGNKKNLWWLLKNTWLHDVRAHFEDSAFSNIE